MEDYYAREWPEPAVSEVFGQVGQRELVIDMYLPKAAAGSRPAVLFVHGGGWNGGRRDAFLWHAHRLSLLGYVTGTIDYRLAGEAPYPAAVDDCQLGMRWLRANASRFSLDPARVGAMGSSAGGHLVACLGVRETRHAEGPHPDLSSRANCVVDVHGIHDFVARGESGVAQSTERFMGRPLSEARELWLDASPITFVDSQSAPTLLTHDPEDKTVPYEQSIVFATALIRAGVPVQFEPTPGSGHGFVYNPANRWTQRLWPLITSWLERHLGGETLQG